MNQKALEKTIRSPCSSTNKDEKMNIKNNNDEFMKNIPEENNKSFSNFLYNNNKSFNTEEKNDYKEINSMKRSYQETFFNESQRIKTFVSTQKLKIQSIKLPFSKKNKEIAFKEQPLLTKFQKCNSKIELSRIFRGLSKKWKNFLQFYLSNCYIHHLHLRQIQDIQQLLKNRDVILRAIQKPDILLLSVQFENNLVKNFCKGLVSFICSFYECIIENNLLFFKNKIKTNSTENILEQTSVIKFKK